mmetsp:Transcript_14340/g.16578  ORF Transcript_14340/g.16578 Transcript_14340/m.16578 type:complete len:102 (+) Transcript_14340:736-1041(+)
MRDAFLGYISVYLTYSIMGIAGYFGFNGSFFNGLPIQQNILNMFSSKDLMINILRTFLFLKIFTTYPLFFHIIREQFSRLLNHAEFDGLSSYIINGGFTLP